MANDRQIELLRRYPGIDLLPVDAADHSQVESVVQADETGDTLFTFLWRELGNAESAEAADLLLSGALRDVRTVRDALDGAEADEGMHSVLLRSYPEIGMLPLDAEDPESVGKAVSDDVTGDTLFSFLWRELEDAQSSDAAVRLLDKAIEDIETVADAFMLPIKIGA